MHMTETTPGLGAAGGIMAALERAGIRDIQIFYDKSIKPKGMWAVVQVNQRMSNFVLPAHYTKEVQPYILWWCKDDKGMFREPNDKDLMDILTVVRRAPSIWDQGEKRADKFDQLDAEKDAQHQKKFKERIHAVAPRMKRALKEGNV